MSDADKIRQLETRIQQLEQVVKDIQSQTGKQPLRVANRTGGGGGIRWTEYVGP